MLHDPMLADIAGKLEPTEKGTIEFSPPSTRHSILQRRHGCAARSRPDGTAFTECAVETDIGVRVPDVA